MTARAMSRPGWIGSPKPRPSKPTIPVSSSGSRTRPGSSSTLASRWRSWVASATTRSQRTVTQEVWVSGMVDCQLEDSSLRRPPHLGSTSYVGPNLGFWTGSEFGRSPRIPGRRPRRPWSRSADHAAGRSTTDPDPTTPAPPAVESAFDPPTRPRKRWNLAGFFNSVGFTLPDQRQCPGGLGQDSDSRPTSTCRNDPLHSSGPGRQGHRQPDHHRRRASAVRNPAEMRSTAWTAARSPASDELRTLLQPSIRWSIRSGRHRAGLCRRWRRPRQSSPTSMATVSSTSTMSIDIGYEPLSAQQTFSSLQTAS